MSDYLTINEAAEFLRCSKVTVYRAINSGELKALRLGSNGSLRITPQAIDEFLRPARDTKGD